MSIFIDSGEADTIEAETIKLRPSTSPLLVSAVSPSHQPRHVDLSVFKASIQHNTRRATKEMLLTRADNISGAKNLSKTPPDYSGRSLVIQRHENNQHGWADNKTALPSQATGFSVAPLILKEQLEWLCNGGDMK